MPQNCDKPTSSTHFAIQFHIVTDENETDVEHALKLLLFHVLIFTPYDVFPRATP